MGKFANAAGMAGMAGGAMAGMNKWLESEEKERLQKAVLDAQEAMNIRSEARQSEQRKMDKTWDRDDEQRRLDDRTGKIKARAGELAGQRGGLLAQGAADAYTQYAETNPEGAKRGLQAVEDAKAAGSYRQPTMQDYIMAQGEQSGDFGKAYQVERDSKGDARAAEQDAYAKEKDARDFKLREQQTNASISAAAAAASDRAEAKADKAVLKQEYEALGHYLASKSANPGADYSQQISASVSKIASLGGNPQVMVDLMLGKETSLEVTNKKEDSMTGESTSEKRVVKGPRVGGAAEAGKPAVTAPKPADTAALKGIIATAKGRGYNDTRIRETLKANGYSDAQIAAAGA